MKILIVGAGLSGAVTARQLAEAGHLITVIDSRAHVAGNCHTERCAETGVLVHVYGPHIFHTDDAGVWDYVNRFAASSPIAIGSRPRWGACILAAHQPAHDQPVLRADLSPRRSPPLYRDRNRPICPSPSRKASKNRRCASSDGDLYEAFFKGYTEKQWGCAPADLPRRS